MVDVIGRDGKGPGEYNQDAGPLAIGPDDDVLLVDRRAARVARFASDGAPPSTRLRTRCSPRCGADRSFSVLGDRSVRGHAAPAMVATNSYGSRPTATNATRAVRSDQVGVLISGNDELLRTELEAEPLEFAPEERAELQSVIEWTERYTPADADPAAREVPRFKRQVEGFLVDLDGESGFIGHRWL